MVTPEYYNKEVESLFKIIESQELLNKSKNICVYSNVTQVLTEVLEKNGYNVREYLTFGALFDALLQGKYTPDIMFMNQSDRDCWRIFESLPSHCVIYSLYQPLFKTPLDHVLNKKYLVNIVGTSSTFNQPELGRSNQPWDNKIFIYDFQK